MKYLNLLFAAHKKYLLLSAFLMPFCIQTASAYDFVEERAYTTTIFHLPSKCRSDEFAEQCARFVRFYSGKFEREFIVERNKELEKFETGGKELVMPDIPHGSQEVTLDFRRIYNPDILLLTVYAQKELNGVKQNIYDSLNIDLKNDRPLQFKDFFDDPQAAAMLCARAFDKKFARYSMPLFDTISATIESRPWNYTLYPDGIEFIFPPRTVMPGEDPAKLFVSCDELKEAGVKSYFFPAYAKTLSDPN